MKTLSKYILQILTSIYCAVYMAGLISEFVPGETNLISIDCLLVILIFLVFLAATIFSWFNLKISGLLLQVWNIVIWLFSWFIWEEAGMVMVLAVPALVIGVLMNLKVYKSKAGTQPTNQIYWRFVLRLLIVNYAILYAITIMAGILRDPLNYSSFPFILFPVLAALFYSGFIVSWFNELVAGILLCLWYVVVVIGSVAYFDFSDSGPWFLFGLTILFQGLSYINNYRTYRSKT